MSILDKLTHRLAVKSAAENLRILKSNPPITMKIFNPIMRENAELKAENDRLKAPSANVLLVTNSAGETVIPVTRRNADGKIVTENLPADEARAWAKTGKVATGTSKPRLALSVPPSMAAKPAPATPATKFLSAAEFTAPVRIMTREEWTKLSHVDRSRFFKEGGKLA